MIGEVREGRYGELEGVLSEGLKGRIRAEGWEPKAALGAVAGMVKVAVTVLPLRCKLLPLRVPIWAEVGATVVGGVMPPRIIVRETVVPRAAVFGDTDVSVGPPGGIPPPPPPPPPPVAVPVAGSKAARAVFRIRKKPASPGVAVRKVPWSFTAAMSAWALVQVLRSVDRSTE